MMFSRLERMVRPSVNCEENQDVTSGDKLLLCDETYRDPNRVSEVLQRGYITLE